LGLLVLGGIVGTLFLVGALMAAAQSLEPYVDTPRTFYAAMADLALAAGAGFVVVAAMGLARAGAWRRIASKYGLPLYAAAALLVALPLAKAATNDAYSSSIGAGRPSVGLMWVGTAGLVAGLGLLTVRRSPFELVIASALPLVLFVVAVLRDTS
jgi:hypothetical protein